MLEIIQGWLFSDYNGGIYYDAGNDDLILNGGHANSQIILNSGNALTLTLDSSQNATFAGDINMTGSSKVIKIDGGGYIDFDSTNLQLNTQRNPNSGTFNDTNKSHAHIGLRGANGGSQIIFGTASANNTAATTRLTIDSSGNVLVTKSSANNATVGNQFMTDGSANSTVDGDTVVRFNRLTSDGEIIRLQKDTSTVGSIGSTTSYLNSSLGIGIKTPSFRLHSYHPTTNVVARFESGDNQVWIDLHDDGSGTYGALLGHDSDANTKLFTVADSGVNKKFIIRDSGNVGISRVFTNTKDT